MSTSTIAAPPGTWTLDEVHSSIAFQVPYLAGAFNGTFREFAGTLDVTDDGAALTGTAKVASVDVKDNNLSAHLQSPDFFDAESHPELSFSSERIALDGESVRVTGEITIKGVTRPIVATGAAHGPVPNLQGNDSLRLQLTTTVDRTEFGVSWNAELPGGGKALSDDVTILAELYFVKET
ncbi:MAG TPA: YceI family protein [Thermoleophilaceae bacterium]|nr:YceI family protein [Thermoleophilaceae bacterium]